MYPWLLHSSPLIIFILSIRHFILYLHIGSLTHVCFVDVKFGIFENYQNFSDVPYTLTCTSHSRGSTVSFHSYCFLSIIEWYVLKNKSISQDLLPLRNRLKWENTLYLKQCLLGIFYWCAEYSGVLIFCSWMFCSHAIIIYATASFFECELL